MQILALSASLSLLFCNFIQMTSCFILAHTKRKMRWLKLTGAIIVFLLVNSHPATDVSAIFTFTKINLILYIFQMLSFCHINAVKLIS